MQEVNLKVTQDQTADYTGSDYRLQRIFEGCRTTDAA